MYIIEAKCYANDIHSIEDQGSPVSLLVPAQLIEQETQNHIIDNESEEND